MSDFFIQALERKPWERHVQTNAKSTFLAQNALPSPTLVPGSPHDDGLGLPRQPKEAAGGDSAPEKPEPVSGGRRRGPPPQRGTCLRRGQQGAA
jgi:hypothetical protein